MQRLPDGEVSPYLVDVLAVGDRLELRGPVGGWFTWNPSATGPVLLVGGGSGLVPLMAMVRTRQAVGSSAAFRLVQSVRGPAEALYAEEIAALPGDVGVVTAYTREAPKGAARPVGRVTLDDLGRAADPAETVYVCGPTGFVEAVASMLETLGHDAADVRTERFGGGRG